MPLDLKFKPDAARTVERYKAWWFRDIVDRPPVTLWVQSQQPYQGAVKKHASERALWMDVEYRVESAVANLQNGIFAGDTLPIYYPNLGPEITATLYGCDLEFSKTTSWSTPVVHTPDDWDRILQTPPMFDNPYWQTIERMTDYALQICDNRYLVGMTDLHGSYDILAALRDPQTLCTDMIDCPEKVDRAGHHVVKGYVESFNRSYAKVARAGFGSTSWCACYHQGPAYVPSCDFWCMVSADMARDMIMPCIVDEMKPLERSIFHLDGAQAIRHLDMLLERPELNAVQWIYGAGNGPAAKWIDLYRRIQRAGKAIELVAEDPADAMTCLEALDPRGIWLSVGSAFAGVDEANAFLKNVERTTVRRLRGL